MPELKFDENTSRSPYFHIADLETQQRLELLKTLPKEYLRALLSNNPWRDWWLHKRPDQNLLEGIIKHNAQASGAENRIRAYLALKGRGTGKGLESSQNINDLVHKYGFKRMMIVAPTDGMLKDTNISGDDGVLACSSSEATFKSERGGRHIVRWPKYGAELSCASAASPRTIRGKSLQAVLLDEYAWYDDIEMVMTALQPAIRPRVGDPEALIFITTTPNLDNPRANDLLTEYKERPTTISVQVPSEINRAIKASQHVANREDFIGSDLHMEQEFDGKIIFDAGTSLLFDKSMINYQLDTVDYGRTFMAIDPAWTQKKTSDYTAIAVVSEVGKDFYIRDCVSGRWTPPEAAEIIHQFTDWYEVQQIAVEASEGYTAIEDAVGGIFREIKPRAGEDKRARAMSIIRLWKQSRVRFCKAMPNLEKQLLGFTGNPKTNRARYDDEVDAVVHCLRELNSNTIMRTYSRSETNGAGLAADRGTSEMLQQLKELDVTGV